MRVLLGKTFVSVSMYVNVVDLCTLVLVYSNEVVHVYIEIRNTLFNGTYSLYEQLLTEYKHAIKCSS